VGGGVHRPGRGRVLPVMSVPTGHVVVGEDGEEDHRELVEEVSQTITQSMPIECRFFLGKMDGWVCFLNGVLGGNDHEQRQNLIDIQECKERSVAKCIF